MADKETIAQAFREIQDSICSSLEKLDGKAQFEQDLWTREEGGGGRTRIIQNGNVFEKGGVNFSEVYGPAPGFLIREQSQSGHFYATGVSIVIHPASPMIPIIHMNIRYLELNGNKKWFGGGIDLTPIYIFEDDVKFFHGTLKTVCDRFSESYYPKFKTWADDYFFIAHRNETRGAGGIFFDHLEPSDQVTAESLFEFVKAVGESFSPVYTEIVNRNRERSFGGNELEWQLIRRGRYAEFNLVYDRGTKFGLETGGRTESILMSLPPFAAWKYDYNPVAGSKEHHTQQLLRKGLDWV